MADQHRLLIVGGTGFLGSRLVDWGLAQGDLDVHASNFSTAAPATPGCTWHHCDIRNFGNVLELVDRSSPDVIVNAAYRQNGPDAAAICSASAEFIARAAAGVGARLVQLSTDLVFDGNRGRPYRETDPPSPLNAYGEAKADSEQLCLAANPDSVVVRTSLIYGDATAPQETLVRRAIEDGDVAFFTDEWRSPVDVRALADAVGRLALSSQRGIVHIAGDQRLNRLDFARYLAAELGYDDSQLVGRTQDPAMGPRAKDVSLDTTLAASLGLAIAGPSL